VLWVEGWDNIMMRALIVTGLLLGSLATVTPAYALFCAGPGADPPYNLSSSRNHQWVGDGDLTNRLNVMRLRSIGVDATSAEYWGGCIKAFVRNPDGVGEHMEFFMPGSLQRVD
jgi:hypothetical protein